MRASWWREGVVVVGAVVGGTVVVVVGATVVVVTGAVVVVVSWAAALPDRTPSMIGVALTARTSAAERRQTSNAWVQPTVSGRRGSGTVIRFAMAGLRGAHGRGRAGRSLTDARSGLAVS